MEAARPFPEISPFRPSLNPGETYMRFSIDVGSELELKLYQVVLLHLQERSRKPLHGDRPRRGATKRRWKSMLDAGQLLSSASLRELNPNALSGVIRKCFSECEPNSTSKMMNMTGLPSSASVAVELRNDLAVLLRAADPLSYRQKVAGCTCSCEISRIETRPST